MKAGIVTFHRAINFGAVLQAYALQTAISQFMPCEIVDYKSQMDVHGLRNNKSSLAGQLKYYLKLVLSRCFFAGRRAKFARFNQKMLVQSAKTYDSSAEMAADAGRYTLFITGSDQVWNPKLTTFDGAYFLDFAQDNQKYSYAACFGSKQAIEQVVQHFKADLLSFQRLSVRERQDAKLLAEEIGREVESHVDPVFLLTREQWCQTAVLPPEKGYILLYFMNRSDTLLAQARALSAKTGAPIVAIPMGYKRMPGIRYANSIGPQEFVGLFHNAGYVLTNSFHGTAFAIIMRKQMMLEYHAGTANANSRFENVVTLFSLQNRVLSAEHAPSWDDAMDFGHVDAVLGQQWALSLQYLEEICSQKETQP